jgi:flagellin FlaB
MNMTHTINRNDAFTGLEAAIVLIAFVVVAAVFAYVVLGAGFFTTQKSQEVVHTGVAQASTNVEVAGEVYGIRADSIGAPDQAGGTAAISRVNFTLALAAGGTPVDMSHVTIVYQNSTYMDKIEREATIYDTTPAAGYWGIYQKVNADIDNVLEKGEMFMISSRCQTGHYIVARDDFNLEIRPDFGAALGITRTAPAALDPINKLY